MKTRFTIKCDNRLKHLFEQIDGKSQSDKISNMLNVYNEKQTKKEVVTKLLSAHMNEIKTILNRQNNIIEDFTRRSKPLLDYIEKATGGF